MLLEKESKVLEKLKVMSVAVDYAEKAGRTEERDPKSMEPAQNECLLAI